MRSHQDDPNEEFEFYELFQSPDPPPQDEDYDGYREEEAYGRRVAAPSRRPPRRRGARRRIPLLPVILLLILVLVIAAAGIRRHLASRPVPNDFTALTPDILPENAAEGLDADWVTEEFLPVNPYSRPGDPLPQVKGIVVHYVGNPGTTAEQNRSYFASLAESGETSASSHFVIGLEGEIIQCVPLNEIAYCSNDRNADTISIECCHPGEDGAFNDATYDSLVKLLESLCRLYHLDENDIIRHYDITGKECPLYFVEHEDEWEALLAQVSDALNQK